jgi:hypothetical protein
MQAIIRVKVNQNSAAGVVRSPEPITKILESDEAKGEPARTDYSEDAIPERDPAYSLLDGTLHEEPTVDELSAEARLALARCLEQLGMSASRAAMVARL